MAMSLSQYAGLMSSVWFVAIVASYATRWWPMLMIAGICELYWLIIWATVK